jgi:hypothetical protein
VLVVVGASNNTLGVSPFLFYFLDGSKKHINLIDNNLKTIWLRLCRAGIFNGLPISEPFT